MGLVFALFVYLPSTSLKTVLFYNLNLRLSDFFNANIPLMEKIHEMI